MQCVLVQSVLMQCVLVLTAGLCLPDDKLGESPADSKKDVKTIPVGTRKQLFVDDYLIAENAGVTRELGQVQKANDGKPLRFWTRSKDGRRAPLEAWIYASVYHDPQRGVFRMWSRIRPEGKMAYGYSESTDGINFDLVSPLKGLHSLGDYNSVVYLDPHETDPAHRYKIGYDGASEGLPNGACLAHSADGIRWTPYHGGKPVTGRAADFTNCLIWDEDAKTYRLFTRTDFGTPGGTGEIRGMRGMTNPDVKVNPADWKTVRSWLLDREGKDEHRRRQVYAMTDWLYCGVHFGLFSIYEWPGDFREGRKTDHGRRHERDIINFYIATSRDGDNWDLGWIYAGQPLVPRGPSGAFDQDLLLPTSWIVTHDDKHWIYYGGANERHGTEGVFSPQRDGAMGLATLRLDGFVGLAATDKPGRVVTRPFVLQGDKLHVNVAAPQGAVTVEVLAEGGEPLEGYAEGAAQEGTRVDDLRWQPRWKAHADLSALKGRTIRLRFNLRSAKLYAFQVVENR